MFTVQLLFILLNVRWTVIMFHRSLRKVFSVFGSLSHCKCQSIAWLSLRSFPVCLMIYDMLNFIDKLINR